MSGVLAIVDKRRTILDDQHVAPMMAALRRRGDQTEVWRNGDVVLGVARFGWELADGYSGAALIVHDDHITVAADASLYYRNDLRRRLRIAGYEARGDTPGHLIAAAYRVWGANCAAFLEGDFAFVLYDHANHQVYAARDLIGRRAMHYADVDGGFVVASTVGAVVAHPRCPQDFDPVGLAETIAVSLAGETRTPYKAVRALPAASWMARRLDGAMSDGRYWTFPAEQPASSEPFDTAVEQLRALLAGSIMERLAPDTPTSIWLSGGYDSPVLYGVGNDAMRAANRGELRPISVTYPEGDPGREDDLINDVLSYWKSSTRWVSIEDIPLLGNAHQNAALADVPFQHAFENWLRALLAVSRREGSRVAIYGDGGDQLFAVSSVFLHDLFGALRWSELHREWQARSKSGVRGIWEQVARPVLGETVRLIKGDDTPEMGVPSWMRDDFVRRTGMTELQQRRERELRGDLNSRAWAETKGSLVNPVIQRVAGAFASLGLEYGVEMRAPLLDRRVVEFALGRPRHERASRAAVKHLLRAAGTGLLPPNVLAPRPRKTGVLTGYFTRSFRADLDGVVTHAFETPLLAELGVVDAGQLREAWRVYKERGDGDGGRLFVAFQTELWLRSRSGHVNQLESTSASPTMRTPTAGFVQ